MQCGKQDEINLASRSLETEGDRVCYAGKWVYLTFLFSKGLTEIILHYVRSVGYAKGACLNNLCNIISN